MTSSTASFKYTDRTDRAFGLCGMALSLFIFDAEKYIDSISIDAPTDQGLQLTPDFFAPRNPGFSVKSVWSSSFQHFQLISAMLIGNLLARSIGRRRADISHQVKEILLSNLTDEGAAACGLEASEVENLCDNAFDYLRRTMLHPTVHETIEKMAKELVGKATLTREQILSALVPLQRL
jgi:hypothetical protein